MDQQLIVAGFHRSGTSFTTQVLHAAGLFVGDDLLGADRSNPYGHFEDRVPFQIHEDVLRSNGTDWRIDRARPFRIEGAQWSRMQRFVEHRRSTQRLWGFKDPRVCFFLGPWKHLLPEAKVLVVFRDYRDAVQSLRRRHAANLVRGQGRPELHEPILRRPDFALDMWIAHNEALLSFVAANRDDTLVLPVEAIQAGHPLVPALNHRFGLGLEQVDPRRLFDSDVTMRAATPLPVSSLDRVRRAERTMTALWNASPL